MNFVKAIVFLLVVVAVGAGGYLFVSQKLKSNNIADVKQMCVQKYNSLPQNSMITDVDNFCECTAHVDRTAGPEQAKAGGKACMDQYGKPNMLKKCEAMNQDMRKEVKDAKGVNCECFYDKMINLFSDQVAGQNGADNLTMEQRRATVAEAFVACKITE